MSYSSWGVVDTDQEAMQPRAASVVPSLKWVGQLMATEPRVPLWEVHSRNEGWVYSLLGVPGWWGFNKIIMYVKELWFIVHLSHPQTLAIPRLLPNMSMARRLWCITSNHSVIKRFWLGLRKHISECFMEKLMGLISNCLPIWFLNYWQYCQAWPVGFRAPLLSTNQGNRQNAAAKISFTSPIS